MGKDNASRRNMSRNASSFSCLGPSQSVVTKLVASSGSSRQGDGFFLFSLAMHEHIRGKMLKSCKDTQSGEKSRSRSTGGDPVPQAAVAAELARLWAELGETQKKSWRSQAAVLDSEFSSQRGRNGTWSSADSSVQGDNDDDSSPPSDSSSRSFQSTSVSASYLSAGSTASNGSSTKGTRNTAKDHRSSGDGRTCRARKERTHFYSLQPAEKTMMIWTTEALPSSSTPLLPNQRPLQSRRRPRASPPRASKAPKRTTIRRPPRASPTPSSCPPSPSASSPAPPPPAPAGGARPGSTRSTSTQSSPPPPSPPCPFSPAPPPPRRKWRRGRTRRGGVRRPTGEVRGVREVGCEIEIEIEIEIGTGLID